MASVGSGTVMLHDRVLLLQPWHLLPDRRQQSLSVPVLVLPIIDCHIAIVLFPVVKSARCVLSFLMDTHLQIPILSSKVTGGIRARDGGDEHRLRNMALELDRDRCDLLFATKYASLLSVTDDM